MDRKKIATHISIHTKLNILANLSRIVISSLVLIYVARKLGPSQYGIVSVGLSIAAIAQLFCDFGVSTSTARFLANSESRRPLIFHNGFLLNVVLSFVFSSVLFFSAGTIAPLVKLDSPVYIQIACIFTFFTSLFYFSKSSLQGIKKSDKIALVNFLQNISSGILIFIAAYIGYQAAGVLLGYSIATAVTWFIALLILRRYFERIPKFVDRDVLKKIFFYALPLLVTSSSYLLLLRSPAILLSIFSGPDRVAYLNIPMRIVEVSSLPAFSLSIVIAPFFTKRQPRSGTQSWLYVKIFKYALLLYLPSALFFLLAASRIINLVFGVEYGSATKVLMALACYLPFFAISVFTGKTLDFMGLAKQKSIVFAIAATTTIVLSVVIIPGHKEMGAALAIAIPYTLFSIYTIAKSSKECGVQLKRYITKIIRLFIILVFSALPSLIVLHTTDDLRGLIISFCVFAAVFITLGIWSKLIKFKEINRLFRK